MRFTVLTLFPEMFDGPLSSSLLGKAVDTGAIEVDLIDPRRWAEGRHKQVDDSPYGGGEGMLLKPAPMVSAIEHVRATANPDRVILMSPQGRPFDRDVAKELAGCEAGIALVCGRYEGFDERIREFVDDELCIGDYVLSGGEPGAWVVIDAVSRMLPGVLGNPASLEQESFEDGLLEYPQYTRPAEFRGRKVPEVLLSGDHARIAQWRREQSMERTRRRRPDLLGLPSSSTGCERTGGQA